MMKTTGSSVLCDLLLNKQHYIPQSIIQKVQCVLLPKKGCQIEVVSQKDTCTGVNIKAIVLSIILYKQGWFVAGFGWFFYKFLTTDKIMQLFNIIS